MANLEFEPNKKPRSIREGKEIQQIEPKNTELILTIFKGFVTDERKPRKGPEYYRVMAFVDVEDEYETDRVKGYKGFSTFDEQFVIPIDSPAHQYLYIELVQRVGSWRDPGTSNGSTVMGRAKIKLPRWTSRKEFKSRVDLVGLKSDGCVVIKGHLDLAMKLHRYVVK